jgi:hypothetical protein
MVRVVRERLTEKTFMGLTAFYTDAELEFMAQLKAGLPGTKDEMVFFHELKSLLGAVMVEDE